MVAYKKQNKFKHFSRPKYRITNLYIIKLVYKQLLLGKTLTTFFVDGVKYKNNTLKFLIAIRNDNKK